ncbi:hypothetical protein BKA64DRAFT_277669 [Cadophora sp. MPI-SDFR-AT-0126]|nr:hypothetical protein BKA64DRAFT_277669 [Leotiomycetes sp. MPI-SDFR-AT-0126]
MSHKSVRDPRAGRRYREYTARDGRTYHEYEVVREEASPPARQTEPESKRHRDRRPRDGSVDTSSKYPPTTSYSSTSTRPRRASITGRRDSEDQYAKDQSFVEERSATTRDYEPRQGLNEDTSESLTRNTKFDSSNEYRTISDHDDSIRRDWARRGSSPVNNLDETMGSLSLANDNYVTGTGPPPIGPDTSPKSRYFSQPNEDRYEGKGKAVDRFPDQQLSSQPPRQVLGTPGKSETLDPSYKIRNRDYKEFFRPGRVFQTLWTDPWTSTTNEGNQTFESRISVVAFNQKVHSKVRRFVVVRQGDRFCTCLPVTSYDGRGLRKKGIHFQEHGFIYSHDAPSYVAGITKDPLRVLLSDDSTRLGDKSLVNYAKPYTVETNVKVKNVGQLDEKSRRRMKQYFYDTISDNHSDTEAQRPVPDRTPRTKEAELMGVGAGVSQFSDDYVGGSTFTNFRPSLPPNPTSLGVSMNTDRTGPLVSDSGGYYPNESKTQFGPDWRGQDYSDGRQPSNTMVRTPSGRYYASNSGPGAGYNQQWPQTPGVTSAPNMRPAAPEYVPQGSNTTPLMSQYGPVAISTLPSPRSLTENPQFAPDSRYQQPPLYQGGYGQPSVSAPLDQRVPFNNYYQPHDQSFGNTYGNQPIPVSSYYQADTQVTTNANVHPHYPSHTGSYALESSYDGRSYQPRPPVHQGEVFEEDEDEIRLPTRDEISASKSRRDSTTSRHRRGRR